MTAGAKVHLCVILFLILVYEMVLGCRLGWGQEHPRHEHIGAVGEFYQTWRSPVSRAHGERVRSCCSNTDCAPIIAMRKSGGGFWEVKSALEPNSWYPVPGWIWEDQQGDPRESPDGLGHVCIMGGQVICAVRASDG